ncbi:diadenosine tetraphosphatase [Shimia sp. SK013]|uniref:metallophosphoesterase family protein n=1 Tax=Shimia sp. SK013 TaxID=1389006 RepID=UPI0006B6577F|nr:metallophosphoesterase family protein [Shimia sp. SK013]KPA20730.1 diadenosine tetraphosphatase [Shimia sp. SK013]
MDKIIYAIGDVHGRDDLLRDLHEHIRDYHKLMHSGRDAEFIHVGDYIDGGAHSREVIDRLMSGLGDFQMTCLLGNHEAMLLECLATDNRQAWYTWLSNGGEETLASFGMSLRFGGYDPDELRACLGEERIAWLKSLPLYKTIAPYLFVHAGIAPGVPIDEQQPKDMLWIRSRFLESEKDHGYVVVHGHTPGDEPVVKTNRICIDTGATSNGLLSAAVLHGTAAPVFLRAVGRPGKTA